MIRHSGTQIDVLHGGRFWLAFCPQFTLEVYHGRSLAEAVGKVVLATARDMGLAVRASWDDSMRTIPDPLPVGLARAMEVLDDLGDDRLYLRSRLEGLCGLSAPHSRDRKARRDWILARTPEV